MAKLTEYEARDIAQDWHGGQTSPLYAFASSGTVVWGYYTEIKQCIANAEMQDDEEVTRLNDLLEYMEAHDDDDD